MIIRQEKPSDYSEAYELVEDALKDVAGTVDIV
jgi:hypothetical protein